MRDPARTPKVDREIDTSQRRQVEDARFPARRVIGLGAIIAVADVMQGDFVVMNVCPGAACYIGLPGAIFCWFDCQPPYDHATEKKRHGAYFAPERPNECQRERRCHRQEFSDNLVCVPKWSVK